MLSIPSPSALIVTVAPAIVMMTVFSISAVVIVKLLKSASSLVVHSVALRPSSPASIVMVPLLRLMERPSMPSSPAVIVRFVSPSTVALSETVIPLSVDVMVMSKSVMIKSPELTSVSSSTWIPSS